MLLVLGIDAEVNAAPDASVARVVWHSQTNQITCSTSAGSVRVMYDPAISDKGAMLSSGRKHRRLDANIFLPRHAVSYRCFSIDDSESRQPQAVEQNRELLSGRRTGNQFDYTIQFAPMPFYMRS